VKKLLRKNGGGRRRESGILSRGKMEGDDYEK
jgi:hypothetical protein